MTDTAEDRAAVQGTIRAVRDDSFDAEFPADALPAPGAALYATARAAGEAPWTVAAEVALHLDARTVRAVALESTYALARGDAVRALPHALPVPVGSATLGRALDLRGAPLDDGAALESPPTRPLLALGDTPASPTEALEVLHTGIKVVDLLAPVPRGGTLVVRAAPVSGLLVMLLELSHCVAAQHGGVGVFGSAEPRARGRFALLEELRETTCEDLPGAILQRVALLAARPGDAPAARARVPWAALTLAEHFRDVEARNVLLCVHRAEHLRDAVDVVRASLERAPGADAYAASLASDGEGFTARARRRSANWITTVHGLELDPERAPGTEFTPRGESVLTLSREIAELGMYPAVDPARTHSALLESPAVAPRHRALAADVRRALARYGELLPEVARVGMDALPREDALVVARARKLQRFLTHPFFVAAQYTGIAGACVPLADTLDGCEAILSGAADDLPEQSFYIVGTLADARAKARV